MRLLTGLLYSLGGAATGLMLGVGLGMLLARLANVPDREGASGYFIGAVSLLCAVLGLIVGIVLFVRSAPAGEGTRQLVTAVLGLSALVLLLVGGVWALVQLREAPLMYDGAMATLEMELRFETAELPTTADLQWLYVELQTSSTRPEGTSLPSRVRTEGVHTIIPVVLQPLYRASRRALVVRIANTHTELYDLPMKRTPDPRADWSEWSVPGTVEGASGAATASSAVAKSSVRFRVRRYGE